MSDGRSKQGTRKIPSWAIGLVLVIVLVIASLYAFTKQVPWGDSYEVKAVFSSAQNIRPSSPVRIAGVNVGEVTEIEHLTSAEDEDVRAQVGQPTTGIEQGAPGEQAAVVTMELTEDARPIREDATFKMRPRLFLEGNYFVDLEPGSPNAEEVDDGHTFAVNQTSYTPQLDQVLSTLQGDVRRDLQILLDQFGNALTKHGGAEGFQELYRSSAPSFKYTSQVNEALLGTEPGDLGGMIRGLDRVVRALGANETELQDLVTNFRIFSGSFAAEDVALGRAIEELPNTLAASRPAFANLNASLPSLRAFAREALPGVQSTPAMLEAATPFVGQIRSLVSERELRGLVADLRPAVPELARLSKRSVDFFRQARTLSSCFNEVVLPWSQDTVEPLDDAYPHPPVGRVFEETAYGITGIASESRSGDANGQYIRVQAGGGLNTVKIPAFGGGGVGFPTESSVGLVPFDLLGAIPRIQDSAKPNFRPDVACETQEPPNLQAGTAAVPYDENTAPAVASDPAEMLADLPAKQIERAAARMGIDGETSEALAELGSEGE